MFRDCLHIYLSLLSATIFVTTFQIIHKLNYFSETTIYLQNLSNMARIGGLLRAGIVNEVTILTNRQLSPHKKYIKWITTSSVKNEEGIEKVTTNTRQDRLYREIQIEMRAHQPEVLKSYSWFASTAAQELDIQVNESYAEPDPYILRKTLLKDVFAHSKHRVQYEMRTYFHMLKVGKLTESTADTYLEYIQRNLPEGVAMKVTKHERRAGQNKISKKA